MRWSKQKRDVSLRGHERGKRRHLIGGPPVVICSAQHRFEQEIQIPVIHWHPYATPNIKRL
jgi:hypothetical protein